VFERSRNIIAQKKEAIEMEVKKAEETVREKLNTSDNDEGSQKEI